MRRYAEGAALTVFHGLLIDLQDTSTLDQKLRHTIVISGADALERCLSFVGPSPEIVAERDDLGRKRVILEEVLEELASFH